MGNTVRIGYARDLYAVDCRHEVTESQRSTRFAVRNVEGLTVSLLDRKRNRRYERSRYMRISDDDGAGAADYNVTMRANGINQSSIFSIDENGR